MSQAELFSLRGRAALVTGASSGIGAHAAATLARAGAAVVLAARRIDRLEEHVGQLRAAGHAAHAVALDVSDAASIEAGWRAVEAALGQTVDEIDRMFDTNLRGAMLIAQQAARGMAERGSGSIINVASTAGLRAAGSMASYGASKAGLIHLTRIMALELAGKGVRVNALAPGSLRTDMHEQVRPHADEIGARVRRGRVGQGVVSRWDWPCLARWQEP